MLLVKQFMKLLAVVFLTKVSLAQVNIDVGIITSPEIKPTHEYSEGLYSQMIESFTNWKSDSIVFNVDVFDGVGHFRNKTSKDCPYSLVISIISCEQNVELYRQLRLHCHTSVLISLFELFCKRPPADIGIGIPNLKSLKNVLPMLADIRDTLDTRWQQIAIMSEYDLDMAQFNNLVAIDKNDINRNFEIVEYKIQQESPQTQSLSALNYEIIQNLKNDNNEAKKVFIVVGTRIMLEKIIAIAKKLSLLNFKNKWIFVFTEHFPIEQISEDARNIISESDVLLIQNIPNEQCLVLKSNCVVKLITDVVRTTAKTIVDNPEYDFNGTDRVRRQTKNRFLSEIKLLFSSENFTKLSCGNCEHYEIQSLLKHRTNDIIDPKNGFVQINYRDPKFKILNKDVGNWNPFRGLLLKSTDDSEVNLKNRPINIGILDSPPVVRITKNGMNQNSTEEISGTSYEIILVLAAKLNFTPNFIIDYNYNFGKLLPNGSWTGMLQKVSTGEVDIVANGYWKFLDRMSDFEFSFSYDMDELAMMVKKTDEDYKYLFLTPFTWDAWLSILATVLLMGPFLWIVHRSSKYYDYYKLKNEKGLFKLGNCFWYCFGAIVQQGGDYLPMAISGRILITFWWLFVIVTVTTYSGNLVALLTFPKIFHPINNLNDLLEYKNSLKYGVLNNSGIDQLLNNSENHYLGSLQDNVVLFNLQDVNEIFDLVKEMQMVFLDSRKEIEYFISEDYKKYNSCNLMIAKESIVTIPVSFVVGKNNPKNFKDKIYYEIGRMAKSGLVAIWNAKHAVVGDDCLHPLVMRAGDVKKIGLSHMMGCFFVLGLGLGFGILSLLVEISKRKQKFNLPNLEKKVSLTDQNPRKLNRKIRWNRLTEIYNKIKTGQLYEGWNETSKKQQAQVQQKPVSLIGGYTYESSHANRANQIDFKTQLERQQKMYYFQKNLDLKRNYPHGNSNSNYYWSDANGRF